MKKLNWLLGLSLAWGGWALFDEARRRAAFSRGPATGYLPDGRPGTALITGASSGIGATFATYLAGQGYDLVIVARRQERLAALAEELSRRHGVQVEPLTADLATSAGIGRVENRIAELDRLTLLINNAGFGTTGRFARVEPQHHSDMISVHVAASTRLARAALPGMIARRQGGIINVASLAGFMPISVNYSATKAYLVMFSEALDNESRGRGVHVQALCPGFTYTEFHDTREFAGDARAGIPRFLFGPADAVIEDSLACVALGRTICIPGWKNRVIAALARNFPTSALLRLGLRLVWAR